MRPVSAVSAFQARQQASTTASSSASNRCEIFRAKRADRVKLVFWDGTGVVLYSKDLSSYCSPFGLS
jgi:transposase